MFAANTGGTTTTVNCSFKGKAIILYSSSNTAEDSETSSGIMAIGLYTAVNGVGNTWAADDAANPSNGLANLGTATQPMRIYINATLDQTTYVASVAFNDSNFVLTFNPTPPSAYLFGYLLLGGSDIINVDTGRFVGTGSAPSTINVTTGFRGDFVIVVHDKSATDAGKFSSPFGFGCATSSNQWGFFSAGNDGSASTANTVGNSIFRNDRFAIASTVGSGPTEDTGFIFAGFTDSGFTVTQQQGGASLIFEYLVIKGGNWACGSMAKPATASRQAITGMNFKPSLLGLFMSSPTVNDTNTIKQISTFGTTTGTTARSYCGAIQSNVVPTIAKSVCSSTKLSHEILATANADLTSFDDTGWTLTWSDTGTAFLTGWFAATSGGKPNYRLGVFSKDAVLAVGAFDMGITNISYGLFDDDFVAQFSGTTVGATATGIASVPPGVFSKDATLDGAFDD